MGGSRRRWSSSTGGGLDALRTAFSAANLRAVMNIVDRGRVVLARVQAVVGEVAGAGSGADILVRVADVLHELPMTARLFVPGNILFRRPLAGETCTVVVPADVNSPGGPLALYGDAGAEGSVPDWFTDGSAAGLYSPETVRVESKNGDAVVEALASGKKVLLGAAATKGVMREGDPLDCGTIQFTFTPGSAAALVILYTPPAGMGAPQSLPSGSGTLTIVGKNRTGSTTVKAKD